MLEHKAESSKMAESLDQDEEVNDPSEEEVVPRQTQRTGRILLFQVDEDQTSLSVSPPVDFARAELRSVPSYKE